MVIHSVVLAVALLACPLFAQSVVPPSKWPPLEEAKQRARAESKLVLAVVSFDEKAVERWMAKLVRFAPLQEAVGRLVCARAGHSEVNARRAKEAGRLALFDSGGEFLAEVPGAFADEPLAVRSLLKLEAEAPAFERAARARLGGEPIEALLISGHALLRAEVPQWAAARFLEAGKLARESVRPDLVDAARLGTILSGDPSKRVRSLEEFGSEKGSPEVRASALVHAGYLRRTEGKIPEALRNFRSAAILVTPGSEAARQAEEALAALGASDLDSAPIAEESLRIIVPRSAVLHDRVPFSALAPTRTQRVDYYLDDRAVASSRVPPFRVTIDLGQIPRSRTVRAVARDAAGAIIAGSAHVVNERIADLGVEFVRPESWMIETEAALEIAVKVPPGRKLQAVEVFWNDQLVARLDRPPYRTLLRLPERHAPGVVRALARDSAGRTAEDARMVNGPGEEVRVDAVQLYAIVEDRAGRPIDGLSRSDFHVEEAGRNVVASVSETREEPITLLLAVDVSSSMQEIAVQVLEAASRFVRSALKPGDRAAVVLFSDTPVLVQPPTSDLGNVERAVLEAGWGGGTALWDSMLFALEQLGAIRGKRALVVFTDLGDTGSRAARDTVVRRARSLGVPIYAVAAGNTTVAFRSPRTLGIGRLPATALGGESQWLSLLNAQFATTGGGLTKLSEKSIEGVFASVRDDLRGQYLVSWVSPGEKVAGRPRAIRVRTKVKGARVRTINFWVPE